MSEPLIAPRPGYSISPFFYAGASLDSAHGSCSNVVKTLISILSLRSQFSFCFIWRAPGAGKYGTRPGVDTHLLEYSKSRQIDQRQLPC